MSRRGSTGPGRAAPLPSATYCAPPAVEHGDDHSLIVAFHGEDDRRTVFRVDHFPLPSWHEPLAQALAARVGPTGTLRTLASAKSAWLELRQFMRFLASAPVPPVEPGDLVRGHVERFIEHRLATVREERLASQLGSIAATLRQPPLAMLLRPDALEPLTRRRHYRTAPKPGYDDEELATLIAAARDEVVAIRARLAAGEALLAAGGAPANPPSSARDSGWFRHMAETGIVPHAEHHNLKSLRMQRRRQWAEQLFLVWPDLTPLMTLLVALSGRNVETIKELPAEHRVLDERAVEIRLTKRRRGPGRWEDTVTWEIGPPHRELHTPGGLYLLVHRLTARGRAISPTASIWSIWRNGYQVGEDGAGEHFDPFLHDIGNHSYSSALRSLHIPRTTAGLRRASRVDHREKDEVDSARLPVDFVRLRTSIEVRRVREMGGHLPSAARSNTYLVLFTDYLRDDPTTIEWARDVVGEALVDAEQAALDAHRRALAASGDGCGISVRTTTPVDEGETESETGWNGCADPAQHPVTGGACRASLLDCFHCANATITPAHLPRLLSLLDALQQRRGQLDESEWWTRYGPAWIAIRHDVLPKFTPGEVDRAAAVKPDDALLDLVEPAWEHP